jgi:hypothetical protein
MTWTFALVAHFPVIDETNVAGAWPFCAGLTQRQDMNGGVIIFLAFGTERLDELGFFNVYFLMSFSFWVVRGFFIPAFFLKLTNRQRGASDDLVVHVSSLHHVLQGLADHASTDEGDYRHDSEPDEQRSPPWPSIHDTNS